MHVYYLGIIHVLTSAPKGARNCTLYICIMYITDRSALLGNYEKTDQQTNQPINRQTDMRGHRLHFQNRNQGRVEG